MTSSRLDDLAAISAAAVAEVAVVDPRAVLDCAGWPVAWDLIVHLGRHFGWVIAAIGADERPSAASAPSKGTSITEWFAAERDRFIETFLRMPASTPCWTIAGPGVLEFWQRRSTFEIARHVWDLRTAGGVRPPAPSELGAERYADGVTEHFDVFLARSRSTLEPLPGTLRLLANDTDVSWILTPDWSRPAQAEADAVVEAPAGEIALLCWERADALTSPHFSVSGSTDVVRAFRDAPIHR